MLRSWGGTPREPLTRKQLDEQAGRKLARLRQLTLEGVVASFQRAVNVVIRRSLGRD